MYSPQQPVDGSSKLTTSDYLRRWFNRAIFHTARTDQGVRNTFIPRPSNDYRPHALRPHWIGVYAAVIIVVKIVAVGFVSLYAEKARQSDVTPTAIIQLTNQARQQFHIAPLRTNALLSKAAQAKADDMVRAHYFAHISPTKVTPWYWFKQAGYSYSYAGENLAIDFLQSEDIIQAWLNSPSHRANLLGTKYKDIGVAVVTGNVEGVDSLLVVQMFGAPLPKPAVKQVTKPSQTPAPVVAKAKLATATPPPVPQPIVLGETIAAVPPASPTIATPEAHSILRTNIPSVVGQAEINSVVMLFVNGQADGSAVSSDNGVFDITPTVALPDGAVSLQAEATARGLASPLSSALAVTVDTLPPTIDLGATYALSSLSDPNGFDVWTTTSSDVTAVTALAGAQPYTLTKTSPQHYYGQVKLNPASSNGAISVAVQDVAGNTRQTLVVDPDLLSTGVVASNEGFPAQALQAVFFSRAFLMTFILLMLVMATVNIVVQIEHQHHPTIIASLLLIYLAGALLFV